MSYIIKNNTAGAIVARLTDAGRKKLSEGKLNVGLFQLGDSEVCYNCYSTLPSEYEKINIIQSEHNAQNLTPAPEKNKGHIKYPFKKSVVGDEMFGPVIQQHNIEEVFNTAEARGFFDIPTQTNLDKIDGHYNAFSAKTGSQYTLSSDWTFCGVNMSGTTTITLTSAATSCSTQRYSPVIGDLISVTYEFNGTPGCSVLDNTTMSQTLFYQVTLGNTNSSQTDPVLYLTVDRKTPNFVAETECVRVRVYPNPENEPMTTNSIYSANNTTSYWCDSTLSFNDCCSISTSDVKIWNMNINWTSSVAGIVATVVNDYGSSGYCGTKEYFGYNSNEGQVFPAADVDHYRPDVVGGTWYYDSGGNVRVVQPDEQKCIGILHYTNDTTTDFYGEKFSMKDDGYLSTTSIGEARNFKLHLPWLMWHKKHKHGSGSGTTSQGDEVVIGQTFYVKPSNGYDSYTALPNIMQSTVNANLNNEGLRYYDLTDDNVATGSLVNIVGKVYPDYKMIIIDDEELLAAMSYKSNRSYTLPVPVTSQMLASTSCASGCTDGILGAVNVQGARVYISYLLEDSVHKTTGMHCNKYVYEEYNGSPYQDVSIKFDSGFPYLGNGIYADKLHILYQVVPMGSTLDSALWLSKDVTSKIVNHSSGQISATNLIATTFYLTGVDLASNFGSADPLCTGYTSVSYSMTNFVDVSTTPADLQFGDEYFFYGSLETDIMATIYEMRHVVQLGNGEFDTSLNPTWVEYANGGATHDRLITEIGLYDNENGVPDLMAIAKLQSPVKRTNQQQFTITIDF